MVRAYIKEEKSQEAEGRNCAFSKAQAASGRELLSSTGVVDRLTEPFLGGIVISKFEC
jgi:hypothetical protein